MSILCIIPARSGSKRLPGKNWEKVGGRTLVEIAQQSSYGYETVVVTDAPERCGITGTQQRIERLPDSLAGDDVPMRDVVRWACEAAPQKRFRVAVLQPTSPLRTRHDFERCLEMMMFTECDSVVSVTYDLATKGYKRNGAIYLTRWELAVRGELMGGWTQFYVMPPERSIDINTAEDLAEARRLAGDS